MPGKGRTVALVCVSVGIAVVVAAGIACRGKVTEEVAIRRLESKDAATRREAARHLGEVGSVKAIPALVKNVQAGGDIDEEIIALCRIGPEGRKALLGRSGPDLSPALIARLGALKADEAAPVLIGGLRVPAARAGCARALEGFGPAAVPSLLACAGDAAQGPAARSEAAKVLGRLRPRDALPALQKVAAAPTEPDEVRAGAFEAIDAIEDRPRAPAVALRISSVEGEPRAELFAEVRADLARPVRLFTLDLEAPREAAQFLGVDVGGTAAEHVKDQVISRDDGPRCLVGLDLSSLPGLAPIEPGKDVLLIKVGIRIDPAAPAGDHPISVAKATFVGLSGKALDATRPGKGEAVIRVKPRAGAPVAANPEAAKPGPARPEAAKPPAATPGAKAPAAKVEPAVAAPARPAPALPPGVTAADFVLGADDVRVAPGAKGAAVRLFATNPVEILGLSLGLRIDPKAAAIRQVSIEGTAAERAKPDHFLWQGQEQGQHVLEKGETALGLTFGVMPRPGSRAFPKGADEHVATVVVDVAEGLPAGTVVPVDVGAYGEPPESAIFTVRGESKENKKSVVTMPARASGGLLLVGASPVPEPESVTAEEVDEPAAGGTESAAPAPRTVLLRWACPSAPDAVRIERDGRTLDEVRADVGRYRDRAAGPGPHRYRLYAKKGKLVSFPVTARIGSKPVPPAAPGK